MSNHRGDVAGVAAAVLFVVVAQAVVLAQIHDYTLLGWDTYPEIASSRVLGFADFIGNFTEETTDGVYQASFYRPVFNLSLAADYAIWGLDPFGYHLTDVLVTGLCAIALFVLSRRLLGSGARLGPWAALLTFVLMPIHFQVMTVPSRRMDAMCGLFAILALATQIPRISRSRPAGGALPAVLTLLAVGSKELGAIVPALVFWMVLFLNRSLPFRERLLVAVKVALTHSIAVAAVFAARFAFLGKLGGHSSTDFSSAIPELPTTLGTIVIRLIWFRPFGAPSAEPWPTTVGLLGILAFVASVAALVGAWSNQNNRRDAETEGAGKALVAGATAITWLLGIALVHSTTGLVNPWHLFMPGLALGLGVGAAVHQLGLWLRLRKSGVGLAIVGLAMIGVWIGWEASRSPLFLRYTHWEDASTSVDRYLEALAERIDASADGTVIRVLNPPMWIPANPEHVGMGRVPGLHVRSLPPWAALRFPERHIEFRHRDFGNTSAEPAAGKLVVRLVQRWPRTGPH